MIVAMRTRAQAAKVAELAGGVHLPGKAKPDGRRTLSRYVEVGSDFEAHRAAVESVSVLFKLYDGTAEGYAVAGSPGQQVPSGWVVSAAKFEVEWPSEKDRAGLLRSHFGARRKAFNWGLDRVKADLDAKTVNPEHESVSWDLGSLRKAWNRAKDEVAPWWATNSKECYSSGLADLAQALSNWSASRNGTRQGRRVGFPRFQSGRRGPARVRFSTGVMRVETDRRTITVPVIGALRAKENTRRVQRHLASGRAHILNMTLSQRWGRTRRGHNPNPARGRHMSVQPKHTQRQRLAVQCRPPWAVQDQPADQRAVARSGQADGDGPLLPVQLALPAIHVARGRRGHPAEFYGPRGFQELAGGGVTEAKIPGRAANPEDCGRLWQLSEQLTDVSYPTK
jgi:hypothetical protein